MNTDDPRNDLYWEREKLWPRVSQTQVAAEMGISHQRVNQIECTPKPTENLRRRYREALAKVAG